MKERLIQLLDMEKLTPSKFADLIGVQRSSVSHVISGRNNPSFDFLQKTLKAFPGLHAEWLILGEGNMYEQMGRRITGNLFDAQEEDKSLFQGDIQINEQADTQIEEREVKIQDGSSEAERGVQQNSGDDNEMPQPIGDSDEKKQQSGNDTVKSVLDGVAADRHRDRDSRRIVQVMVFYDDDTFRSFRPS